MSNATTRGATAREGPKTNVAGSITKAEIRQLVEKCRPPCVSLYLPTRRGGSEADRIRWKNLIRAARAPLAARGLRAPAVKEFLAPARRLLSEPTFWQQASDGLAFFLAPAKRACYRLPLAFAEQVVVGDRFHLKPLLPLLSDDSPFLVLAISQNRVRLLRASRDRAREIDLKNMPASLAEALQFHDRDEPLTFHTRPASGGGWAAIFSGQGVGIDDHKDDLRRYFRRVDQGLHNLLRGESAPLVLASVEYLWPIYREANTYPGLLEQGIAGNPDRLSIRELHARAWDVVQPRCHQAREKAAALYRQLAGTGRTCGRLDQIVRSAAQGQIAVLFVALDQERWGRIDDETGDVVTHEVPRPGDEDLLNLAALATLASGGTVYAVERSEVPGEEAAAAIFWHPLPKRR